MNVKVIIAVMLIFMTIRTVLSRPTRTTATGKPKVIRNNMIKILPTKNTVVKSFAVANNGAFIPVNVLNLHAVAYKNIEEKLKKIEVKKTLESSKASRPTLNCIPVTETPLTEKYDHAAGKTRANTLFTSHNWGNQK